MGKFFETTFSLSNINGGEEYINGDGLQSETQNAVVEASAYVQSLGTNSPNLTNANNYGNLNVYIESTKNGAKFVFENLSSATGAKILGTSFLGEEENGDSVYEQTFDNGETMQFVAPKGDISTESGGLQIGTVETVEAGSNLEIKNVGTLTAPIWNFKIPKGEKGEKGEKGKSYFDFSQIQWFTWSNNSTFKLSEPLENGIYLMAFLRRNGSYFITYTFFMFIDEQGTSFDADVGDGRSFRYIRSTQNFKHSKLEILPSSSGGYYFSNAATAVSGYLGVVKISELPQIQV